MEPWVCRARFNSQTLALYREQQGKPLKQWRMFTRPSLFAEWYGGIVSFPAQNSFSAIDETRITLAIRTSHQNLEMRLWGLL